MDYAEFRAQYEQQHPASVPRREDFKTARKYPTWLPLTVLVMFICAALMSGVHTVPTVRSTIPDDSMFSDEINNVIALGSFVAVELAIFVTAYAFLHNHSILTILTMVVAFMVALASNLLQVSKALQASSDGGTALVAVVLGIGAPLIALLSGKMFVEIQNAEVERGKSDDDAFRKAGRDHDARIATAWEKHKKRVESQTFPTATPFPFPSNGNSNGNQPETLPETLPSASTLGHRKEPDASEKVRAFFEANPHMLTHGKPLEIAAMLSVGKSTVYNVKTAMETERRRAEADAPVLHSNGHGKPE